MVDAKRIVTGRIILSGNDKLQNMLALRQCDITKAELFNANRSVTVDCPKFHTVEIDIVFAVVRRGRIGQLTVIGAGDLNIQSDLNLITGSVRDPEQMCAVAPLYTAALSARSVCGSVGLDPHGHICTLEEQAVILEQVDFQFFLIGRGKHLIDLGLRSGQCRSNICILCSSDLHHASSHCKADVVGLQGIAAIEGILSVLTQLLHRILLDIG